MIVFLTQSFPSRLGGIENLVSNLALNLSKKEKILIFADSHNSLKDSAYDSENKKKISVDRTGGLKFFRRRKKIRKLKTFINHNKVKFVIADTWKSMELVIEFLNNKNIPTICLAHGNELLYGNDVKYNRIKDTLNKVSAIIANSQYTKGLIKDLKLKNKNVSFVYPGANDLRKIEKNSFIELKGEPILITLARLEKRKGHVKIIEAVRKLKLKFPSIKYIIAGEGPERNNLKKIVQKYNLNSSIYFVGLVNESQKKFLYEKADLMVMPTLDESKRRSIEGFGIAYLEAAFFSIPSIASNVGGTPEAVLNNKTGVIIKNFKHLYHSIYKILLNKKLLKRLGKNAQTRAIKEFSWRFVIKNYIKKINIKKSL